MLKFGINAVLLLLSFSLSFAQDKLPNFFFSQVGEATFYGKEFNNRKTSSGELYKKDEFTAAHPFLAFGTSLRVTNLNNNRVTIVRVNDRGPFKKGRIIDLSYAAAKQIDMVRSGIAKVKIETLSEPEANKLNEVVLYNDTIMRGEEYYVMYQNALDSSKVSKIISANGRLKIALYKYKPEPQKLVTKPEDKKTKPIVQQKETSFAIQVGAFINYDNAAELKETLQKYKYKDVDIISLKEKGNIMYKVTVGSYKTHEAAAALKNKLLKDNIIGFTITKGN